MLSHFLKAVALGLLGLLAGCGLVAWATSQWTELSTRWINAGFVFPLLGLAGGLALAEPAIAGKRDRFRFALSLAAAVLCTAGNFLAYVITSRTWFGDRI